MSAHNDGGPAFPTQNGCMSDNGMTLRDWFAGMALQGIISKSPLLVGSTEDDHFEYEIANGAYAYADAMLSYRKRKGKS